MFEYTFTDMSQNFRTRFLLKKSLLMSLVINICCGAEISFIDIVCRTAPTNNLSMRDDQIIIFDSETKKSYELADFRKDYSSLPIRIFLHNCTLRPGFFIFLNFTNLFYLNSVAGNRNTVLTNESFIGASKLATIYLVRNDIEIVEPFAFSCLYDAVRFSLSGNKIKFLPVETFQKMTGLIYLYLDDNCLQTLPEGIFDGLDSLEQIYLNYNAITYLPDTIFQQKPWLQILLLQQNNFKVLNQHILSNLTRLKYLDISNNKGLLLNNNTFLGLENLKKLNLIECDIVDLPKDAFIDLKSLKTLNMNYNNITEIRATELLDGKYDMLQIHLEYNQVKRIHAYLSFTHGEQLRARIQFYLTGNPFICDCHTYSLYSYLKNDQHIDFPDGLECKYPKNNRQKNMISLDPKDFICNLTKYCSESCTCIHRESDNANIMNCSNRNYEHLPFKAPYNTSILDISHNNLTSLSDLSKTIWENLTEVHAEYNHIVSTDFYLPKNVNILKLHHNNLKILPNAIIQQSTVVKDIEMTLAHNSWQCDCSIRPFKIWLSNHISHVTDTNDIYCIFPNKSMSTSSVIKLKETDICSDFLYGLYVISPGVSVLLVLTLMFYYRYKIYILSYFYSHFNTCYMLFCCNRRIHEDKAFDCFIAYSSEDREVTMAILEEFETKPPYHKFCIHERNWMPGRFITTNIVDSVQQSRKILIIISKTFLKSEWFYLEFQAAYYQTLQDKTDRLVLIIKGDLPSEEELDSDVQHVISSKTYLKWGERWFWEKLRYAIYQQNAFTGHKKRLLFNRFINLFKKKAISDQQGILLHEET